MTKPILAALKELIDNGDIHGDPHQVGRPVGRDTTPVLNGATS